MKSKETVVEIKRMLQEGLTCKEVASRLKVCLGTVYKYRDKEYCSKSTRTVITKEVNALILETYLLNFSIYKTAKSVGVSPSYVGKFIRTNHKDLLKYNQFTSTSKPRRKWQFNEHYFDKINTPEKAYILGFLYADGYNYEKDGSLKIGIWTEDIEILNFISSELELVRPYEKCKGQVIRLNAHSKHMSKSLKKWGCGQAKTFKLKYPTFLEDSLHSHFIRGYFDGDGCMYYLKRQATARLSYTGYIPFLDSINKILVDKIGTTDRKTYPINGSRGTGSLEYTKREDIEKIEKFMYSDCMFCLKRKQNKVQHFLSTPPKQKIIDNTTLVSLYKETKSLSKVAKELGISVMTVYTRLLKYQPDILTKNKYRKYATN